jgi:CheY-like chemotaxis protein
MSSDERSSIDDIRRELEREKTAHQQAKADAEQQRRLKDTLEDAVRSRDAVLSVVAHDLRNPLNIIALAAGTVLANVQDSTLRRSMERIVRSAQRADRMISDLLTSSAIETGRFVIDTRPVETAELILSAIESQYTLAAAASVIVAPDLSPKLPPMEADEERMMDVLENLIGNAIKFTAPGGAITVGASHTDDQITVWVKDSGSGIAPEQLPYIFDRFWQAKEKERRGIGLGLSICKGTVEAHGGRIWAESTLGVGTTLIFTVPQAKRGEAASETSDVANVLLVDDRPENLLALQAILERPEYRLVMAKSGQEALTLVLRERFAVALVDIAMPGMTGLEVATHLKELDRSRDIPIIFVTAFGDDPQEIHRAYSAGGADYLVKPLDPEIVRKKVAVFVDLSRRQRRAERI